jgi:hypothetical protein
LGGWFDRRRGCHYRHHRRRRCQQIADDIVDRLIIYSNNSSAFVSGGIALPGPDNADFVANV